MHGIRFAATSRVWHNVMAIAMGCALVSAGLAATPATDSNERLDNPPQVAPRGPQPSAALVAPFVTTPTGIVDEMLSIANTGPDDFVIDLGSGDGRLVIAAVTRFGVRGGMGVDLDPHLVRFANDKAREAGVSDRATFFVRDLFDADISAATVVTVYLLPGIMGKVQDKLLAELKPGTRVVVHDYPFPSWQMDRVRTFDVPEKSDYTGRRSTSVYLYTVPARAAATAPARP